MTVEDTTNKLKGEENMIDYEELILERQEEYEEPTEHDCRFCKFLHICQADEELELEHHCYAEDR